MSTFASRIYSAEDEPEELETVSISGEYWFDESGNTMYADGDVGDMGHEAHVIQVCIGTLASEFDMDAGDEPHLDTGGALEQEILIKIAEDEEFVKKYLKLTDEEMETEDIYGLLDNDPASAMIEYLKDNTKMSPDKINGLVLNAYGSGDAREYAIKEWDWSRVQGDAIEVKELTADMLKVIARGIGNALDEEGLIYEYEDTPEVLDEHEYTISTYTGKRYTIKLKDMESGNVEGLERSDLEIKKSAATDQLRKMDVAAMPDFYKQKGVIGDSMNFNQIIAYFLEYYNHQ